MIDFSIFMTAEAWISLATLIFLEIVLGVDNIAFIALTTNRLRKDQRHIGRKLGLAGAMLMRCLFLCFASWLVHMVEPIFMIELGFYAHGFSIRDLLLAAGGIYLIIKGIQELRSTLALDELRAQTDDGEVHESHLIGLPQAITTIMVMDIVFSIDSVITAVGLAEHLIIMIIAVITAVLLMMAFIDPVSEYINEHVEIKILALVFITTIGILLTMDGFGFHTGIEIEALGLSLEKLLVYFAMVFSLVLVLIQMRYKRNVARYILNKEGEKDMAAARES